MITFIVELYMVVSVAKVAFVVVLAWGRISGLVVKLPDNCRIEVHSRRMRSTAQYGTATQCNAYIDARGAKMCRPCGAMWCSAVPHGIAWSTHFHIMCVAVCVALCCGTVLCRAAHPM